MNTVAIENRGHGPAQERARRDREAEHRRRSIPRRQPEARSPHERERQRQDRDGEEQQREDDLQVIERRHETAHRATISDFPHCGGLRARRSWAKAIPAAG
ncbi:MAG: hypothetical protein QM820_29995 [Minicystis sp.]